MKQNVDVVRIRENSIQLNGWVIGKTPESVPEFQVTDGKGKAYGIPLCGHPGETMSARFIMEKLMIRILDLTSSFPMRGKRLLSGDLFVTEEKSRSNTTRS